MAGGIILPLVFLLSEKFAFTFLAAASSRFSLFYVIGFCVVASVQGFPYFISAARFERLSAEFTAVFNS